MYGLAVNLIMSVSGHPSIINEIYITTYLVLQIRSIEGAVEYPINCLIDTSYCTYHLCFLYLK